MDMRSRILRLIRDVITGVRKIVPFALRATGLAFRKFLFTFASLWRGVPETTDMIANDWLVRTRAAGMPSIYHPYLYWTIRIIVFLVILIEWVCFSFVTVFVVTWVIQ